MIDISISLAIKFLLGSNVPDATNAKIAREVARLLRAERVRQKISMRQLSRMSGISQSMISYVEHDKSSPTLDSLLRIANALDIDLADLMRKAISKPR